MYILVSRAQFFGTEVIGPEPLEPLPLDRSILGLQEAARLEAAAAEEVGLRPSPDAEAQTARLQRQEDAARWRSEISGGQ